MGKRKLITGIVVGAVVGGITALFDGDTRSYTKQRISRCKDMSSHVVRNPAEAVNNVKQSVDKFYETFSYQAENAVNALEQVEQTLGTVSDKLSSKRK
ncbi:YtxH domain-containing protein [Virgibacillus sp. LDC-1]|uniref:YtxH domain-containing protein n=1 Tax=Virgibacillus sp. LDC-1 TaxID=3039856 RepID=UPI0024DE2AAD|nr:YtxH domain-containing protein [Virgibacillus sp. LDC-1]